MAPINKLHLVVPPKSELGFWLTLLFTDPEVEALVNSHTGGFSRLCLIRNNRDVPLQAPPEKLNQLVHLYSEYSLRLQEAHDSMGQGLLILHGEYPILCRSGRVLWRSPWCGPIDNVRLSWREND